MTRDEARAIIDRLNTPLFGGRVRFHELNKAAQAELGQALHTLGIRHDCQSVGWDGGEYVPCRRFDTHHFGVGVWLCPEHANTHRRFG